MGDDAGTAAVAGADADAERVRASLAEWVGRVTFVDRGTDEVTALLVATVADWAAGQGWRVYRRAPSVVPLPPPYAHRRSSLDVACARPVGRPVVVEVDRADRRRTVDKLVAEAAAGRIAIWLRWGYGRFTPPPPPVGMVTCEVTTRRDPVGRHRLHSRLAAADRPAPAHSAVDLTAAEPVTLFAAPESGSAPGSAPAAPVPAGTATGSGLPVGADAALSSTDVPQHQDPA